MSTGIGVDEFLAGDWPDGAQLVAGEVVVDDPTFWHQHLAGNVHDPLRRWARAEPGRGVAGWGGNWVLASGQVYKPDVWWVSEEHRFELRSARHDGPPDLVVEVRSPGTWLKDIGPKRDTYEQGDVAELWLVDNPAEVVLVLRRSTPASATFDVALEVGLDENLASTLLPGFLLPVRELFAEP